MTATCFCYQKEHIFYQTQWDVILQNLCSMANYPLPILNFTIFFNPSSSGVVSLCVMLPHKLVCEYCWQILTYGSGVTNGGYCSGGM